MGVEQVKKIFSSDDLHNFVNLSVLIKAGCQNAGLKLYNEAKPRIDIEDDSDSEEGYVGWWFKSLKGQKTTGYFCGFYMNEPHKLVFEIPDEAYDDYYRKLARRKIILDQQFSGWDPGIKERYASFPRALPENFTDLSAAKQGAWMTDFINAVLKSIK